MLSQKERDWIKKTAGVLRRKHFSTATEESYCGWLARYMAAVWQMPKELSSEAKLERFLTDLAVGRDVAASTQNQAFHAICFFYAEVLGRPLQKVDALRATRPQRLRHAISIEETRRLLDAVQDSEDGLYKNNLIVRLLYGCGLRVREAIKLRVKDVRADRIFIVGGKGQKDRVVPMPCALWTELSVQLDYARHVCRQDSQRQPRLPLALPHRLGRKYPEFQFSEEWAWVFPAKSPALDERSSELVRGHMHEANVQRAVKEARRRTGVMVVPHELRHSYATHLLEGRRATLKGLAATMGHKQIETTAGYCHAEALSVPSPMDVCLHEHPPPRRITASVSDNQLCEPPLRSVLEFKNSNLLSSMEEEEGTQLRGGQERALLEEGHTRRAMHIAAGYRHDDYVMTKLQPRPGLREELMAGRTPTARKFAKLYETNPHRARKLLSTAAEVREGKPAMYLNKVLQVEGVRY